MSCECGNPVEVTCRCDRAGDYCRECIARHVFVVPGEHFQQGRKGVKDGVCQNCRKQSEQQCGECSKVLCGYCFAQHRTIGAKHIGLPLAVLQHPGFTSLSDSGKFAIKTLYTNLAELPAIKDLASKAFDSAIKSAYKAKLQAIRELDRSFTMMKSKVDSFVNSLISQSDYEYCCFHELIAGDCKDPTDYRLINVVNGCEQVETAMLSVFVHTINNALFEPKAVIEEVLIPNFANSCVYHLPQGWSEVIPTSSVKDIAEFYHVALPAGKAFLTGSPNSPQVSILLELATGAANFVSQQRIPRTAPGLGFKDWKIYLFGGSWNEEVYRSSEVFDIVSNRWSVLPRMNHARHHFQPCQNNELFYLFGGCTAVAETFNTKTLEFQKITWLNDTFISETVSAEYNRKMIVFDGKSVYISERKKFVMAAKMDEGVCHKTPTVRIENKAYFLSESRNPMVFDFQSSECSFALY